MRQTNTAKSLTSCVIQQNLIRRFRPDCGKFDRSRPMKNKLEATSSTVLQQLHFCHREVMFQKILFATQSDMNKVAQMIQRANFSRCFREARSCNRLTHAKMILAMVRVWRPNGLCRHCSHSHTDIVHSSGLRCSSFSEYAAQARPAISAVSSDGSRRCLWYRSDSAESFPNQQPRCTPVRNGMSPTFDARLRSGSRFSLKQKEVVAAGPADHRQPDRQDQSGRFSRSQ